MSTSGEEYVKALKELMHERKQEAFNALYPSVETLLKEQKAYDELISIYMFRATMYFQVSDIDRLVHFIAEHLAFFRKHANEEQHLRFKNVRALALEMIGYREGFYEQMVEMKEYGERHHNEQLVITATLNIGFLKVREEALEEALYYFECARALAAKNKATDVNAFNDYYLTINNLFGVYLSMERYDEAKAYLHLEDEFDHVYPRYKMLYLTNTATYYVMTNQFEQARTYIQRIRTDIDGNEAHDVYKNELLQCELELAKKLGDISYEKHIYEQLIALQKKNNKHRLLQQIMQSSYTSRRNELIEVAQCDGLTGLLNRRGFVQQTELLKRRYPEDRFIACAMIDVDHFKRINDEEGHLAGDALIRHVAAILQAYDTQRHVCARYGGDEFVVTFTAQTEASIHKTVEQLFHKLQHMPFIHEGKHIRVTFTLGAMYVIKNETCAVESLLALADEAMYEVKRNGRAYYAIKSMSNVEVAHEEASDRTV